MYILRKQAQELKNTTVLHFMTTFHNLAFIIEAGWAKKATKPILETRCFNDVYYFSDKTIKKSQCKKE